MAATTRAVRAVPATRPAAGGGEKGGAGDGKPGGDGAQPGGGGGGGARVDAAWALAAAPTGAAPTGTARARSTPQNGQRADPGVTRNWHDGQLLHPDTLML